MLSVSKTLQCENVKNYFMKQGRIPCYHGKGHRDYLGHLNIDSLQFNFEVILFKYSDFLILSNNFKQLICTSQMKSLRSEIEKILTLPRVWLLFNVLSMEGGKSG